MIRMKPSLRTCIALLAMSTLLLSGTAAQSDSTGFKPIYFEQDSSSISHKYHSRLDAIGEFLSEHPEQEISISVHGLATEEQFYKLVTNRMKSVTDYLEQKHGIDENRFSEVKIVRWTEDEFDKKGGVKEGRKVVLVARD